MAGLVVNHYVPREQTVVYLLSDREEYLGTATTGGEITCYLMSNDQDELRDLDYRYI